MNPRTALITGASSGIGEAFAEVFAAEGFDLVITARREHRLRAVADRLVQRYAGHVQVIAADLSERDVPARLCREIADRGLTIDVLVNNAGYGLRVPISPRSGRGTKRCSRSWLSRRRNSPTACFRGMVDRGYGRIINVASLAALVPAPAGHTLYAACKALVVKFSESLSNEVARSGVRVTALCPGFTRSEFHDVTGTRASVARLPRWLWMDAAAVARQGFEASMAGIPVYVPGRVNRAIVGLARYLPRRVVVAVGRRTAWRYRKP